MKKIYYKKIIGLFLIVIFVLICSSCKNDNHFHAKESGDWIYSVDGCSNGQCALLGLSDIGKTKEVIVLPTEIDGLRVSRYGNKKGYIFSPDIVFDNCKKLYCNYSYITVCTGIEFENQEMEGFFPHQFSSSSISLYGLCVYNPNATIFLSQDFYNYEKKYYSIDNENCFVANIEYYLDDENCFFIDNVESGKLEVIQPKPFKDGYVFEGWYINDIKWDFENNLVEDYFDENNHLRLEAKWEELK